MFKAAAKYREEELALYEIDREKPFLPLWTARLSLIDALESLYGSTERLIRDRTRDFGSVVDEAPSASSNAELRDQQVKQNLLKNQMEDLAAALCINMEDRLRVASRWVAPSRNGHQADRAQKTARRWRGSARGSCAAASMGEDEAECDPTARSVALLRETA